MNGLTNIASIGGKNLVYLTSCESVAELPAIASENTLCVVTTSTVTDWKMSDTIPDTPVDGMVWIRNKTKSTYKITLANTEKLELNPSGCTQYIVTEGVGAWTPKPLYLYQNASWNLTRADIIINGTWVESNSWNYIGVSVSYDATYKSFSKRGSVTDASQIHEVISTNTIDARGFTKLVFDMYGSTTSTATQRQLYASSIVLTPSARSKTSMRAMSDALVGVLINVTPSFAEYELPLGGLANKEAVYIIWSGSSLDTIYTYLRNVWLE